MFKIVKLAQIKVIKPSELEVGDYILWANWKRRVIKINHLNRFIVVSNSVDKTTESLPMFLNYYKIISYEEIESEE
jgi:hypothetical protein